MLFRSKNAVLNFLKTDDRVTLEEDYHRIHKAESIADDIRRDIEVMMYSKALFPESRSDILNLLESIDRIPSHAEHSVQMILNQHVSIPAQFKENLINLLMICDRCVEIMITGVRKLFSDFNGAAIAIGQIDELESEADDVEYFIISQIFTSNLDGFHKLLVRDIVRIIAGISDRAENVGDRDRKSVV